MRARPMGTAWLGFPSPPFGRPVGYAKRSRNRSELGRRPRLTVGGTTRGTTSERPRWIGQCAKTRTPTPLRRTRAVRCVLAPRRPPLSRLSRLSRRGAFGGVLCLRQAWLISQNVGYDRTVGSDYVTSLSFTTRSFLRTPAPPPTPRIAGSLALSLASCKDNDASPESPTSWTVRSPFFTGYSAAPP